MDARFLVLLLICPGLTRADDVAAKPETETFIQFGGELTIKPATETFIQFGGESIKLVPKLCKFAIDPTVQIDPKTGQYRPVQSKNYQIPKQGYPIPPNPYSTIWVTIGSLTFNVPLYIDEKSDEVFLSKPGAKNFTQALTEIEVFQNRVELHYGEEIETIPNKDISLFDGKYGYVMVRFADEVNDLCDPMITLECLKYKLGDFIAKYGKKVNDETYYGVKTQKRVEKAVEKPVENKSSTGAIFAIVSVFIASLLALALGD